MDVPEQYREATLLAHAESGGSWKIAEPADHHEEPVGWEMLQDDDLLALQARAVAANQELAAAVARVALRKLASPQIAANVSRQSHALREGLMAIGDETGVFAQVRGRGLMLGAVLGSEYAGRAGEILDHAAVHGLLLLQAGPDVLRLVPALNITDADVAEGLARLRKALAAFTGR